MTRPQGQEPLSAPAKEKGPIAFARRVHLFRRPALWIAVGLVAAATGVGLYSRRGTSVLTVRAQRRDLEQRLVASGRVLVPSRVQVSARSPGLVLAVAVREGDRVHRGDLLVQLDDAEARTAVRSATAAVNEAGARAQQLRRVGAVLARSSLAEAESNTEHARVDLARDRKLAAAGSLPPSQLDDARHTYDLAAAQRIAARATRASSTPGGADTRLLHASLDAARAQLAGAEVRLSETRLLAQQDGTVLLRSVEPGDMVQPARALLVLAADDDRVQLVFQSDERNLEALRPGQVARASADAFPRVPFDAVLSYIAPSVDPARGSIEVRLDVPHPPSFLRPEMTVSVDLAVGSRAQVLTLPSAALHAATTPAPWVYVVEAGRLARRSLSLGLHGEGSAEVLPPWEERTEVVVSEGLATALAVGQRVRPHHGLP